MHKLITNIYVKLEIKHKYLPVKLQEYLADDDYYVSIGLSPALRLRRRPLYITSPELAIKFVKYFEDNISNRKFKNDYKLSLVVDNAKLGKHETRWQEEDIHNITERISDIYIDSATMAQEIERLENQLSICDKDRNYILNNYKGDTSVNKVLEFHRLIQLFGYEDAQQYKSKSTFRKYVKILNELEFSDEYLKNLKK